MLILKIWVIWVKERIYGKKDCEVICLTELTEVAVSYQRSALSGEMLGNRRKAVS
jgi:hypothetical protein